MMDYDGRFLMQKTVDWSLLNDGMTIPTAACALLKAWDESILTHGVGKDIKVLIDGEFYEAKLKNQNFEQSNWAGHKDVIQIRYGRQSALAAARCHPRRSVERVRFNRIDYPYPFKLRLAGAQVLPRAHREDEIIMFPRKTSL